MSMVKPNTNLNLRISEEEKKILKAYCEQTSRQQSEVIREFIRSLAKKLQKLEASNL
jgi:predicted DNA-binding protein